MRDRARRLAPGGAHQPPALTGGNATVHPADEWVAQQLREATPFGDMAKHLMSDNDTKFRPVVEATDKTCGLEVIHTPYEAPRANAICEQFVSSVRRESLDHMLVFGSRQLMRVMVEYAGHFNPWRPHQELAQPTPDSRRFGQATVATGQTIVQAASSPAPAQPATRRLMTVPVLNRLHHSYAWVT